MGFFSFLTGGRDANVSDAMERGAVIIDVRTPMEFKQGNVKGSVNIPLDQINNNIQKIKKMNKPVVAVCASGNRSGSAKSILLKHGIECYNGGGWRSLSH
jgi:rhodanese-related sulfurtransferase